MFWMRIIELTLDTINPNLDTYGLLCVAELETNEYDYRWYTGNHVWFE